MKEGDDCSYRRLGNNCEEDCVELLLGYIKRGVNERLVLFAPIRKKCRIVS